MKTYLLLIYVWASSCFADSWIERLEPYMIPDTHPAKEMLDGLCRQTEFLRNDQQFKTAGFVLCRSNLSKNRHWLVGYHHQYPQWMIKAYADEKPNIPCAHTGLSFDARLANRAQLAAHLRERIAAFDMQHVVVPQTWVYPIPAHPGQKRSFLIVEEMLPLTGYNRSCQLFFDTHTWSERWVEELVLLFQERGIDRLHLHGAMRFLVDEQRIAFFDLEYPLEDPSPTHALFRNSLPEPWRTYWEHVSQATQT